MSRCGHEHVAKRLQNGAFFSGDSLERFIFVCGSEIENMIAYRNLNIWKDVGMNWDEFLWHLRGFRGLVELHAP